MPIRFPQLDAALRAGLKPVYLVSGDEPLQLGEAADAIRTAARERGYAERVVLTLEAGFDWNRLAEEASAQSLFAEKRLLELRLGSGKPGQTGAAALLDYLQRPPANVVLLIQSARLDRAAAASRWVKAVEKTGVWVAVWPLGSAETRRWLQQRLQSRGLQADAAALTLLLERVEGNLLAAAQEVERLSLLAPPGPLRAQTVLEAVGASARYDVGDLAEAALAGDAGRVARILSVLRGEGVEPTLAAWALVREARQLARLIEGGGADPGAWRGIVPSRRRLLQQAAARWPRERVPALIRLAARLDRRVKGQGAGDPWDELLQFSLFLGGRAMFPPGPVVSVEEAGVISRHERK